MKNAFLDAFKQLDASSLQTSFFPFDDQPHYHLLSEGIQSDGQQSPFAQTFDPAGKISELAPAENNAQQWMRGATDLERNSGNYLNKPVDSFTDLHARAFGLQNANETGRIGLSAASDEDLISQHTPEDWGRADAEVSRRKADANWDNEQNPTADFIGPISKGIERDHSGDAMAEARAAVANRTGRTPTQEEIQTQMEKFAGVSPSAKPQTQEQDTDQIKLGHTYADRQAYAKRLNMTGNDYFAHFGRINGHATPAKIPGLHGEQYL